MDQLRGMPEAGPFTLQNLSSGEKGARIDFTVGRPWGKNEWTSFVVCLSPNRKRIEQRAAGQVNELTKEVLVHIELRAFIGVAPNRILKSRIELEPRTPDSQNRIDSTIEVVIIRARVHDACGERQ